MISIKNNKPIWKKSIISGLSLPEIESDLEHICEIYCTQRWDEDFRDSEAGKHLENFHDDFIYLGSKAEDLLNEFQRFYRDEDDYNDLTVAVLGDTHKVLGYDIVEEDYQTMFDNAEEWATSETAMRIKRKTKDELLYTWQNTFKLILCYMEIKSSWDSLYFALEAINNEGTKLENIINDVNMAYELQQNDKGGKAFRLAIDQIPTKMWVE